MEDNFGVCENLRASEESFVTAHDSVSTDGDYVQMAPDGSTVGRDYIELLTVNKCNNNNDDFGMDDLEENGKIRVPISVCLLVIASYIMIGSILFTIWEGWDFMTGSYFCFVTLSTIGFGDIVPGTRVSEWASESKLVLCALWLAFGLSILAMCFNLMQEEVKEKCKWLGQKIGILRDGD